MTLLTVSKLTKKFNSKVAVSEIDFTIEEGRCVALLGPNGAGKTTTLNMLSGLLSPSSGTIQFQDIGSSDDIRQFIGYLPQYPAFHTWMTGLEFLEFAGELALLPRKEARSRAIELVDLVGIADAKNRRISGYSGGMKQRLGLAQALIHRPRLLILDEPVSALDPIGRRDVLTLMRELKQETTLLFSTHVLHDAESVCDDVLIIHDGKIVIAGSLQDVRAAHQQPLITVEFEEAATLEAWLPSWSEHEKVVETIRDDNTVKLIVHDLETTKRLILKDIVDQEQPIRQFAVSQTTLEDLFMKVVSK